MTNVQLQPFAKGHGTQNDFIILPDVEGKLELSAQQVARLCDRRRGLGADGVLRVVTVGNSGVEVPGADPDDFFMDYYNADGSIAQMCGNGTRVFAHYVRSRGLVDTDEFVVATRAGLKPVKVSDCSETSATVRVEMGPAEVTGVSTAAIGENRYAGLGVDMGNPHLACVVPGLTPQALGEIDLQAPEFDPEFFPEGVNVELVTELDQGRAHMRVYERGVGETRSCGTGTVAATRAVLADAGQVDGTVTIVVPGGEVEVTISGERSTLTGPSEIVATGELYFGPSL